MPPHGLAPLALLPVETACPCWDSPRQHLPPSSACLPAEIRFASSPSAGPAPHPLTAGRHIPWGRLPCLLSLTPSFRVAEWPAARFRQWLKSPMRSQRSICSFFFVLPLKDTNILRKTINKTVQRIVDRHKTVQILELTVFLLFIHPPNYIVPCTISF